MRESGNTNYPYLVQLKEEYLNNAPQQDTDGVYKIYTAKELASFAAMVLAVDNDIDGKLMNNIDMNGITDFIPIGKVSLFDADGSNEAGYTDTFDGQGYIISNLIISDNNYVTAGLFGNLRGTVKNIGLDNVSFAKTESADGRYGVLCGLVLEGGTVENCYVINSSVDATDSRVAGVIAGGNYGETVKNCYTMDCTFTAYENRGGYIAGDNTNDDSSLTGTVENCYTDGSNITGSKRGTVTGGSYGVSDDIFAGGEIAYKLNGGVTEGTQAWYQNIGSDSYPVFEGETVCYDNGNDNYYNYILGNVDMKGTVDKADAALLLKYLSGIAKLTDAQKELGNVNGGDLDITDAVAILKMCEQ